MSPGKSPTIGQRCAEQLKTAKLICAAAGKIMSWEQVAEVIDGVVAPPKAARSAKSGPALHGDPCKIPPTPDQVTAYSASIGYPMNGASWCDSYEQKGWKVGKGRMKNWQAAVRNWKTNGWGEGGIALAGGAASKPKDYTKL